MGLLLCLSLVAAYPDSAVVVARSTTGSLSMGRSGARAIASSGGRLHFVYALVTNVAESCIVFYRFSNDGGQTWSASENVSGSESLAVSTPNIAVDGDGRVHCIWSKAWRAMSGREVYWDYFYARRDTVGWTLPMNLSQQPINTNAFFQSTIAVDARGRVHAVWEKQFEGLGTQLYHRFLDGDSWSRTCTLTRTVNDHLLPCLAADGEGRVWLAWLANELRANYDTIYLACFDTTWSAFEPVVPGVFGAFTPSLAIDPSGRQFITYDAYAPGGGDYDVYLTWRDSLGWQTANVSNTVSRSIDASVTVDSGGMCYVVWTEIADIMLRCFDGRYWSEAINISSDPEFESFWPLLAFPARRDRIDVIWPSRGYWPSRVNEIVYLSLSLGQTGMAQGSDADALATRTAGATILRAGRLSLPAGAVLYDATGRKIAGRGLNRAAPGVYFYALEADERRLSRKVVLAE